MTKQVLKMIIKIKDLHTKEYEIYACYTVKEIDNIASPKMK